MPLINSIEVANFMNRERRVPFEPTWPHCVFPLLGLNSIINVPNGRGKTTIVTLALFLLTAQKRKIDGLRNIHFAPKSSGSFTHLRVQMIMDTEEGAGFDLLSGTPLGKQMVFGIYGRCGDNEDYKLYSYQGSLDDCPVHRESTGFSNKIDLIPDKEFEANLSAIPYKFPSSARESSADAWKTYVDKWFDITSIEQQISYQLKAGGEGKSSYFDVPGKNSEFASNVFYEHLAPELLHDVMGGFGEEDEKKIEDTIHEKTRQIIQARIKNTETATALEQTGRVLHEMQRVCDMAEEMAQSVTLFQACKTDMALELGALKDAIIDRPFPGLPGQPPAELADVGQFVVLYEGGSYLSDRGIGYFSGEEPKMINQRADRNKIIPATVEKTKLLEITCDLAVFDRSERGKSNQVYDLDSSIRILAAMENFLPEWTKETAIIMVQKLFDWAENHADTSPARMAKKEHDEVYRLKNGEFDATTTEISNLNGARTELSKEQSNLSHQMSEYQRMQHSGLFSPAELVAPEETGSKTQAERNEAKNTLDSHNQRVTRLEIVFGQWRQFIAQYGVGTSPDCVIAELVQKESETRKNLEKLRLERDEVAKNGMVLHGITTSARERHNTLHSRITTAEQSLKQAGNYDTWFKGECPEGLEAIVRNEQKEVTGERNRFENELAGLADKLESIEEFRTRFGVLIPPGQWLKNRATLHEKLRDRSDEVNQTQASRRGDLKALEEFSVAPGQFALIVQKKVGVAFVPLHAIIENMPLDKARKESLLTLFSALLFAPVLQDNETAETAARNLATKKLEFPVFVKDDLERFCHSGDIAVGSDASRSLFIGVRTQNVDCLLDPAYLEDTKRGLTSVITALEKRSARLNRGVARSSHDTATAKLAERARHAIESGSEETAIRIRSILEPLVADLVRLDTRASDLAVKSIRAMVEYNRALNGSVIEDLRTDLVDAKDCLGRAEAEEGLYADSLQKINTDTDVASDDASLAKSSRSEQEPILKNVASFMADPEHGPEFMENAKTLGDDLARLHEKAIKKSGFDFNMVQKFVDGAGAARYEVIRTRLGEIDACIPSLEEQKRVLFSEVSSLGELGVVLAGNISKVDGVARVMIRLYRKFRMQGLPSVDISSHEVYRSGRFIRNCRTLEECVKRLISLDDDVEFTKDRIEKFSSNLKDAEDKYKRALHKYHEQIENSVKDESLKLADHVVQLLLQAKEDPSRIRGILAASHVNYDKDCATNEYAKQQLDSEWSEVSNWLSEFTRRLPSNLDLMKNRFAPKKDQAKKYVSAGFIISADVIAHDDIEDVLKEIVLDIEEYEESGYIQKRSDVRRDAQSGFRREIRNKFFKRVLTNPGIKVFIPSISREKAINLDRDIASSGQSVAISLLWIIKMSDFVSERERAMKTVSMSASARRKMRLIKSQFVFIDGAFSHLSDKALIDDVLGEIANTRGKFQLIVTGHDSDFKPNWKLFPTMLNGREVGGRYMFIDKGEPVEPGDLGSHYGAMTMMQTHVINTEVPDGPTAH